VLRVHALADVGEVVQNVLFQRDLAGFVELLVRPLVLPGDHVVARVLAGSLAPIPPHSPHLPGNLPHRHLLYCSCWLEWATSSIGRALRSQCRGWGFDPPVVHQLMPARSLSTTQPQTRPGVAHLPAGSIIILCESRHPSHSRKTFSSASTGRIRTVPP